MEVGEAHYTSRHCIYCFGLFLLAYSFRFRYAARNFSFQVRMNHRRLAQKADHQFDVHEDSELLLSDLELKVVENDGRHLLQKEWELRFEGSLAHDNDDCEV